jgi:hypothetical protein
MYDQYKDLTMDKIRETVEPLLHPKEPTRQVKIYFFSEQAYQAFDQAVRQEWEQVRKRLKHHHRKPKKR